VDKTQKLESWLDLVKKYKARWKKGEGIIIFLTLSQLISVICIVILVTKIMTDIQSQRLVLVPGIQRKIYIPAEAHLSEAFIRGVSSRVVNLQENWNHITIKGRYQALFDEYLDDRLENRVKTNLELSNRFDYVTQHKMTSEFLIDYERSRFSWCKKLNRACSLVVGTRKVFVNRNDPYSEKEVAYLLITEGVFPDDDNPHAVRFIRMKINDTSEEPYDAILKIYDAALKGVMPDA